MNKHFNADEFSDQLYLEMENTTSWPCSHSPSDTSPTCPSCISESFDSHTSKVYDSMCPLITKSITLSDKSKLWYNSECRNAKRNLRKAERIMNKPTATPEDKDNFLRLRTVKNNLYRCAKVDYYHQAISDTSGNPAKTYAKYTELLGRQKEQSFPHSNCDTSLANDFKDYFLEKV